MILFRDYNQEKRMDRAWYSSSNIVYSECDDIKDDYKTGTGNKADKTSNIRAMIHCTHLLRQRMQGIHQIPCSSRT